MKRVVSVSLGSSKRNHVAEVEILGEQFRIERLGTDGDSKRAVALINELDGQVDAFGMGGIDLYVWAGKRRYILRDAVPIAKAAKMTPIVDGSGLKNTLERRVINYLQENNVIDFPGKKVLMVCAVDRFGMAESLAAADCRMVFGDLIFTLGIPLPLTSLRTLNLVASVLGPIISKLPFSLLYPTGGKQERVEPRYAKYYAAADIVAGDFHFIRRFMPEEMSGKIIITNTVTADDVGELQKRGVRMLITTTPVLNGRSFGTNVMEGVLVTLAGKPAAQMQPEDYLALLDRIGFVPRIEKLN
ncbi:MAG: quinate 5-dehydrogenase [bacterium]